MADKSNDEETMINDDEPTNEFLAAFDELDKAIQDDVEEQDAVNDSIPVDWATAQRTKVPKEETPSEEGEAEADENLEGEKEAPEGEDEILPHLVAAGRGAGLTDEEIVDLSVNYPKALEAMVDRHVPEQPEPKPEPEPEPKQKLPDEKDLEHVDVEIPEGMDENTAKILQKMAANQNVLIDQLKDARVQIDDFAEVNANHEVHVQQERDNHIDDFLDSQAKVCPALGLNKTLTPGELEVRQEIFNLAEAINGKSDEDKLTKAVLAYNGMTGEAEKNISRKLFKNKAKFSPRPGGKKDKPTFKSDLDRAEAGFNDAWKEMGLE